MPAPSIPTSPNTTNAPKLKSVHDDTGDPISVREVWLQQTWNEEWSKDGPPRPIGPQVYTSQGPTPQGGEPLPNGTYCKVVKTVEYWKVQMGQYYYIEYTIEKKSSKQWIFGAVLLIVGLAAVVITAGAATPLVGSVAAWAVAAGGGLSAGAAATLTAGGTLAVAGGLVMREADDNIVKGVRNGSEGYYTDPIGTPKNLRNDEVIISDWALC